MQPTRCGYLRKHLRKHLKTGYMPTGHAHALDNCFLRYALVGRPGPHSKVRMCQWQYRNHMLPTGTQDCPYQMQKNQLSCRVAILPQQSLGFLTSSHLSLVSQDQPCGHPLQFASLRISWITPASNARRSTRKEDCTSKTYTVTF